MSDYAIFIMEGVKTMEKDLLFNSVKIKQKQRGLASYADSKKARLERLRVDLFFNLILVSFWAGCFILAILEG